MKDFNARLHIRAKKKSTSPFLLAGQLDIRQMTKGPMSEQKVETSFLFLHAINLSLQSS